jgi:hypothetical protein
MCNFATENKSRALSNSTDASLCIIQQNTTYLQDVDPVSCPFDPTLLVIKFAINGRILYSGSKEGKPDPSVLFLFDVHVAPWR